MRAGSEHYQEVRGRGRQVEGRALRAELRSACLWCVELTISRMLMLSSHVHSPLQVLTCYSSQQLHEVEGKFFKPILWIEEKRDQGIVDSQ